MNWHKHKISFVRSSKGNAGILFAICLLPLFAVVGSAKDIHQYSEHQDKFEHAVDFAAISAARYALTSNVGDVELLDKAKDIFDSELTDLPKLKLKSFTLERDVDLVRLDVAAQMPTGFMKMVGKSAIGFNAEAEAHFGEPLAAEVALVLDTSYSMQGTRLEALQSAAADMIDSLITANPETVKMSIVPFSTYVNVGTDKIGQSWLDVEPTRTGSFEKCSIDPDWYETKCTRESYACIQDGVQKTCLRWNCLPGDLKNASKRCETTNWTEQWHGCVKSRRAPYNSLDTNYRQEPVVGIRTNGAEFCPTKIRELTDNRDDLKQTLDALRADQNTYIASGLIWGLRTLSSRGPFKEAEPYKDYLSRRGRKALVLMSDGANTRSPTSDGQHAGQDRKRADRITREVCEEVKSQGIEVYTIAFELEDEGTKTLLLNCATRPRYFFDANNTEALGDAFKTISANFSNVALVN